MATRSERLASILEELVSGSLDVVGAAVVSVDGFVMSGSLPAELDEDVVATLVARTLEIGGRVAGDLLGSEMQQVVVKGPTGFAVLDVAGPSALLLTLTGEQARLGLVFLDARRAASAIEAVLRAGASTSPDAAVE